MVEHKNSMREHLDSAGKEVLRAARTELYIDMRFMGSALSSLGYEMDLTTTTVGTDAVDIRFNPSHVLRLFMEEPGKLNRTYVHMLLHCIFRHMYTSAGYEDERLFDLCADIVVESILDTMDYRSISRISSDFRDEWYALLDKEVKVLTVEKLYRYFSEDNRLDIYEMEKLEREFKLDDHGFWLRLNSSSDDSERRDDKDDQDDKEIPPLDNDLNSPQNPDAQSEEKTEKRNEGVNGKADDREKNADNKDNQSGNSDKSSGQKGKNKEKYINPRRLQKIRKREKDWDKEAKRIQTEIETIGKNASDRLGKLEWILKFQNTSRTDYKEFLQRFKILREEGGIDLNSFDYGMYTFGLMHYGDMPLIEENEFREVKKIQELAIVIDTSASCKDELVQKFLDETAGILLDKENFFQRIRIHIIQCDDQIQRDDIIESVDDMKKFSKGIHLEGGYGTDFRPVFEYIDKLRHGHEFENLKGLLYFTDGYGTYPDKATAYDTAFVFPQDEDYEDDKVPDWALKLYMI